MTIQEPGAGSQPVPPTNEQPPVILDTSTQEQKPGRNVLALVALIVSIVGFIFGCIPGALIVGWVLLPIAFILGIVSLFLKGKGKGLGITAIIIAVVGTIVAFIVFFAVVATSFNDAFSDDTTVTEPGTSQSPVEDGADEEPADAEEGTRDNPVALGSTITSDDWTVVVNSYDSDGDKTVLDNEYNDKAPKGSHYEVANYTVTYTGDDSELAAFVSLDVVTETGNVVNSYDNLVLLDDSMGVDELFNGASATGSVAFVVPDDEDVLLRVQPGMLADEVFVKP